MNELLASTFANSVNGSYEIIWWLLVISVVIGTPLMILKSRTLPEPKHPYTAWQTVSVLALVFTTISVLIAFYMFLTDPLLYIWMIEEVRKQGL